MARIRSFKPEFTQNDKLSALPAETHLLAAGLICYADDEGYFQANPKLVQAAIFPLRELSGTIPEMLRSLTGIDYIETFSGSDGRSYGRIVNFLEHQRVSHPVASKIKLFREISGNIPEVSVISPETFCPELKGNRIEGEGEGIPEAPPDELHPNQYATRLLEEISFPQNPSNIRAVASAIECEIRRGKRKPVAYEFVLAGTRDAMDEGHEINTFFFTDAKYRAENRRTGNGQRQTGAAVGRESRNRQSLIEAARSHVAKRVGRDGGERQDRTNTAVKRGVVASSG